MARPSNTRERRAQIALALMRVMAKQGYEGASVGTIAEAAGLAPGLVHYHFGNKQEILLDLIGRLTERLKQRFSRRLGASAGDPWRRLHAYLDAHLALGDDADPAALACWVAIGAEALRQREVREVYVRAVAEELAVLEGLLRAVLRAEGRPTRRAGSIAVGLFAAIQGCYQLGTAAPGATPAGFAAPTLRLMAERLIRGQRRAKGVH